MQVQYRGSAGFGKAFLHAGDKQWAGDMQAGDTDRQLLATWFVGVGGRLSVCFRLQFWRKKYTLARLRRLAIKLKEGRQAGKADVVMSLCVFGISTGLHAE